MSSRISRREFLKAAGFGGAVAGALSGCGTAARYVQREPYRAMPEFTRPGESTYFATTCGECPAGCGLIVRTMEGRAHKIEGNPAHPVNHGKTCARGQAALQGLYNPDRIPGPRRRAENDEFAPIEWDAALEAVTTALQGPGQNTAFLLGLFPDHLHDLVGLIAEAVGGARVLRFSALGEFEARVTLMDAAQKLFGRASIPHFDIEHAAVTFSFGANFTETWLSPVAYTWAYGRMRQGFPGQRGYLVHFEPRMSQTAATADEWIPIHPGSEAQVAQSLGRIIAELTRGALPTAFENVDVSAAALAAGIPEADLRRLARLFIDAPRKVAIPGGIPLGQTNGALAAEAILILNILGNNLGRPGGLYFLPEALLQSENPQRPSTLAEIGALIEDMNRGEIQTLFVHNANPVYELPAELGFEQALAKVPTVFAFSPYLNETATQAHYLLPDHTPLESWGYQQVVAGADRAVISSLQPVVAPVFDTRATADVLLGALQAGGETQSAAAFGDEVDFIIQKIAPLISENGPYQAANTAEFWTRWLQFGGWWRGSPGLATPISNLALGQPLRSESAAFAGDEAEYPYFLLPYPHPNLAAGETANRPWLQEAPDPMTTVMWNTWVEIHPQTAQEIGAANDELVRVASPVGEITAAVYIYPGIHPGTIAIPLGQGHTALGRYAAGRGANPLHILAARQNEAGNLAFMATRVQVTPTGEFRPLSTYESRTGVYGEEAPFVGEEG